jgi:VCBS repeat-containing protein
LNNAGKFDATISSDGRGGASHFHVDSVHGHAPPDAIIVPEAHFLFHADFKRSGLDLVLHKDDHELVLHNYFKGEKHAALASPDGAHLTGDIVDALTGSVEVAQAGSPAAAGQIIGHVTKLVGSATAIRNGVSIILNMGDNVEKGDVVESGSASTLGITFIDGTVFGLSANARMVLNEMVYDPNGSNNSSLLSLVAGTITFVAGETAKHGDMKVDTPVATMGIRGTAVLVEIDFTVPGQGATPDAHFQVLVEPDGTTGSYILFDKSTLQPLAVVNQAGQQINISNGIISQSSAPLSPDVEKLIQDVFTLKFSGLTNPKSHFAMNDSIVPDLSQGFAFQLTNADIVHPVFALATSANDPTSTSNTSPQLLLHIDLPPTVVVSNGSLVNAGTKGPGAVDTVSGSVKFADVNAADLPTVQATFSSLSLQDAQHNDVTSTLTPGQLAAIEAPLILVANPANNNNGSVAWTYSVADGDFSFLKPNETLQLTYTVKVETNYAPANTIVSVPLTITIIGQIQPTIATTNGSIVVETSITTPIVDHTGGTITFADADTTAHPEVTAQFISLTYQDASHHDLISFTPEQQSDIAALEIPLTLTPSASNGNNGSVAWSYDIADGKLDFLGAGETLTLTYTATVDDGHGGTASAPITVTINGTDHIPTIEATSGTIAELPSTNADGIEQTGGTITFAEASLTDRPVVSAQFTSFSYQDGSHHDITSSLTVQQQADIAAIENSLLLTASDTNTNNGTVSWSYSVPDNELAFLSPGATLTLTYTATVDDGHGGLASQPLTISITNDLPTIVGESNPPVQNVIAEPSNTIVLDAGVNTNSLGFPTETFDGQPTGSLFDNGAGSADFFSAALDATFTSSGNAGIVNGTLEGVTEAPIVGPLPGQADATNYLSIGAGGTETIKFGALEDTFGLYWGSVDPFNQIDFYKDNTLVATFSGGDISQLLASHQGLFASNGYVQFLGLAPFDEVVLSTGNANSFEVDNISAGAIHSQLAAPITGTLTVDDPVVGDSLTGSVIGNATAEYNGSTTLPSGADIDALISATAIKFDSVISDGGSDVLNWTYQPTNADLDFLKPGDTLTVTYTAEVEDGNIAVGSEPLTITIVGSDPNANMSGFSFVSGTSQNDTFNNVGNGVTIFGGGGQDSFNFKPGFGSATIGDFNVNLDAINIDHSLFASVAAILASAQAADSGRDTIIVDSAHDQIKFVGVTVAQIQAHPGDFHLV